MNILALDTASPVLSAALAADDGIRHIELDSGLHHSELLPDLADRLLKLAGLEPRELSLVACMKGPGSFTGLRIGFAAAKGMAASLNIPYVSVPTLDCMAAPHAVWPGTVIPVIDAKKNLFFTALYRQGNRISDFLEGDISTILKLLANGGPSLITGPDGGLFMETLRKDDEKALTKYGIKLDPAFRAGHAKNLLAKAKELFILYKKGDESDSGPLYLRKSDAELNARR